MVAWSWRCGEAHEAPATPGQHGTEDLQPVLGAPVEDEVLTGDRLPGSIGAALPPVFGLGFGHGPPQRATRAGVSLGSAEGQQALGTDAAIGALHLRRDELEDRIGDLRPGRAFGLWAAASFDDPSDGLVGRAAERCGRAIAAQLGIGGEDVQLFPRSLHNGRPSGLHGGGLTSPLCDPGASPGGQGRSRGGDFLLAISGDFVMATGMVFATRRKPSRDSGPSSDLRAAAWRSAAVRAIARSGLRGNKTPLASASWTMDRAYRSRVCSILTRRPHQRGR